MSNLTINVAVDINLSDSTKEFLKTLFATSAVSAPAAPAKPAPAPAAPAPVAPAPAAPAKPAPAPATKPATKPATAPAPAAKPAAAPAPAASSAVSIEDVRTALAAKVNDHREEIREKLNEFGARNVTSLDASHYADMLSFLQNL